MHDIIISTEGIGLLKSLTLLGGGAAIGAYVLLSRGVVSAFIALALVAFAWMRWVGGDAGAGAAFIIWFAFNWMCTLAIIGMMGVGRLIQAGQIRAFSSDILKD